MVTLRAAGESRPVSVKLSTVFSPATPHVRVISMWRVGPNLPALTKARLKKNIEMDARIRISHAHSYRRDLWKSQKFRQNATPKNAPNTHAIFHTDSTR